MSHVFGLTRAFALLSALACVALPVNAQEADSMYVLPERLAVEAAAEAVRACSADGNRVTASVVDASGIEKVMLRGDRASVNTVGSSFRKAYTVVTMGPIWNFDLSSQFTQMISKYPPLAAQSLIATPNVTAQRGGAAIRAHGEIVAAIGVGGSPGGEMDEACAIAGVNKIQNELPH